MKKNCLLFLTFIIVVFFSMSIVSASASYIDENNSDHGTNDINVFDNTNNIIINNTNNNINNNTNNNNTSINNINNNTNNNNTRINNTSDNISINNNNNNNYFTDIYVGLSGNDNLGDGSQDNPYKSLKKAINEASNNSNIYILSGEYFGENNTKMIIDKTITISGIIGDNGTVMFNGERKYDFFEVTPNGKLTLINITFYQGNNSGEEFIAGAIFNNGELIIKNCIFEFNTGLRGGAILNNGKLDVIGSIFKNNNGTNYGGGITNFNTAIIIDSVFIGNIAKSGSSIFNDGNLTILSSNFTSNNIMGVNWENRNNNIFMNSSNINSDISVSNHTIKILNSSCANVGITDCNLSVNSSTLSVSPTNSTVNITYSVITGGSIYNYMNNNNISAEYNWWLSNYGPVIYSGNTNYFNSQKYWIIAVFVSDYGSSIPSKNTNVTLKVIFKYTDGVNVWDLPEGVKIPYRSLYLQTDNGYFNNDSGILCGNIFTTYYLNNSEDTLVYAVIDNQRLKLAVGKGYTNYTWYVSNEGDDSNNGSFESPFKTLAKAVSVALNGNTIYIASGDYYNAYNSNLFIWKNLTFSSYNGPVTIYRHTSNSIFVVADYGTLNLNNITFSTYNLTYSVFFINCSGNLTINNCTFKNASGNSYWGNILFSGASLYVNNSKFLDLRHFVIKSGAYDRYSYGYVPCTISILNSYFTGISGVITNDQNSARILYLVGDKIIIDNCTFVNNAAIGAVINSDYSIVNNSNFISNSFGAVSGASVFDNGYVVDNAVNYWSGSIVSASKIMNSLFSNNNISCASARFIYNCSFINNRNSFNSLEDDHEKNGIINSGNLTVVHCIFSGNIAGYGGAIFNRGFLNVSDSVFVNNTATILGADIFNFNGNAYLDNNWWGWNGGPTNGKVYRFLGNVQLANWVILSLNVNGSTLIASLDKVTDSSGNIRDFNGTIPSRIAFFDSSVIPIYPKINNLTNNYAYSHILSGSETDYIVNVTVDGQNVDLTVHNKNTIIEMNETVFYGKNNIYTIILRNVNGYDISNQTVLLKIKYKNGTIEEYNLITGGDGRATIIINNSVGNYDISAFYEGDGYFYSSNSSSLLKILPSSTKIFILKDQLFYGKNNVLQISLEDIYGRSVVGQKIYFNIKQGNKTYNYYSTTNGFGIAGVIINLPKGSYDVKVSFNGDEWYSGNENQGSFTILPIGTNLSLNVTLLYGRGDIYFIKLLDNNGNVAKNETIYLTLSQGNKNQTFSIQTDSNGTAGLVINLIPGTYKVSVIYKGDDLYIGTTTTGNLVIEKVSVRLTTDPLVKLNETNNKYYVLLTDMYGRPLCGESLIIKIQKDGFYEFYNLTTDNEGFITIPIDLIEGNYMVLIDFNENEWYYNTTSASTLIVSKIINKITTNITITFKNNTVVFYLTDTDGNLLINKEISIKLVGNGYTKYYTIKTNYNGKAELKLNISSNSAKYNLYYNFEGVNYYNSTEGLFTFTSNSSNTKIKTLITVNAPTIIKGKKTLITATLKSSNGKILANKKVKLIINKKTYIKTTNSKGIVVFQVSNLKTGKYVFKLLYGGDSNYHSSTISKTQTVKNIADLVILKVKRYGNSYKILIKNQGSVTSKKTKVKIFYKVGKKIKYKIGVAKSLKPGKHIIVKIKFFKYSIHKKYLKTAIVNYNKIFKELTYNNNLKKFKT
ncbi:Ig-like domain repeat protein [Methanobrevibacter sp.]|uniref:Ig-like domain repeat protein n=1 Tax=Methanobrevibacter sp. TaxID=66852 RepID=UPI00260C92A8|nr:Ig-like domain repeat protein [uncultured Methanobrevibacter sp.]